MGFDERLFLILNRGAANGPMDAVMPVITNLHQQKWFFAVIAVAAVAGILRHKKRGWVAVIALVVAIGLADSASTRILKPVVGRPRPCHVASGGRFVVPDVRIIAGESCPGSPSFPSNHAANTMAAATVCVWLTRGRKRWAWLLLPAVIGYSRIYLGYHYPSDVLAGWLLGFALALSVVWAARRVLPPSATIVGDAISGSTEPRTSG